MMYYRLDLLVFVFKKTFNQDTQYAHLTESQVYINPEHNHAHKESIEVPTIN